MTKIEELQHLAIQLMTLFNFDILLLAGIAAMVIAIISAGKATQKLKAKNARNQRRNDALLTKYQGDLARH